MADITSDPEKVLRHFEPGSEGEQFVKACTIAAGQLMEVLQGQFGNPYSLSGRIDTLEERIEALSEKLDRTDELLHNLIEVLKGRM